MIIIIIIIRKMAESKAERNFWPVILHESLADSEVHRTLQTYQHLKIRGLNYNSTLLFNKISLFTVSSKTPEVSCMFPQSSVIFLLQPLYDTTTVWPPAKTLKLKPAFLKR